MAGIKKAQNFEEFKVHCLKKSIEAILEGYYTAVEEKNQLKAESKNSKKPRKVDVSAYREEIKRLKAIESKYNRIMAFATESSAEPQEGVEEPKVRKPRKPRTPKASE